MNTRTWNRKEVKAKGMVLFKANYWKCVLVSLILAVVAGGASSTSSYNFNQQDVNNQLSNGNIPGIDSVPGYVWGIIGGVFLVIFLIAIALAVFAFNPLALGCDKFYLENHNGPAELSLIGYGFSNSYLNVVKVMFFRDLYTFLWTLLLIVPGIVKGYEYRMIPYLLAQDPSMSKEEAFAKSKEIMTGQKWNAFVFDLSFIGWELLSALTLGILGLFYVNPYVDSSKAELFYELTATTEDNMFDTPVYTVE